MEAKHTPGPWKIQGYANYYGWSVYAADRGCIAERWYDNKQDAPYADELAANANLIAAAPDLLAACEALPLGKFTDDMANHDAAEFTDNAGAFFDAMCKARAAIAKATGN